MPIVSAAAYVEDVEKDPVVIFDGLTKNWRYPGWRTTWTIGPRQVIEAVTSAGSFLDGGGSKPLQRAAVEDLVAGFEAGGADYVTKPFRHEEVLARVRALVRRAPGLLLELQPERLPLPQRAGTVA